MLTDVHTLDEIIIRPDDLELMFFSELDFKQQEGFVIPTIFKDWSEDVLQRVDIYDEDKFEQGVFEIAARYGYDKARITGLEADELIRLAYGIVCAKLTYTDVCDKKYSNIYPVHTTVDNYLVDGLGKCVQYNEGVIAVFDLLKRYNTKSDHVFIRQADLPIFTRHGADYVFIFGKDNIQIAMIDPTNHGTKFPASNKELDTETRDMNNRLWKYNFFCSVNMFRVGFCTPQDIIDQTYAIEFAQDFSRFIKSTEDLGRDYRLDALFDVATHSAIYFHEKEYIPLAKQVVEQCEEVMKQYPDARYPQALMRAKRYINENEKRLLK